MESRDNKINTDKFFEDIDDNQLLELTAGESFMDVIVANFTNIIKFILEP